MVKVKKAIMYKDIDKDYYIDVTYTYEDENIVKEINFPKVHIPLIGNDAITLKNHRNLIDCYTGNFARTVDLAVGDNTYPVYESDGKLFTEKIIKEKTHKMTVAEIEKKLGYKIEIVSEKGGR